MANEIVHVELLAKNLAVSSKFYTDMFGWQMTPWGEEYIMFKAGDGVGGALLDPKEEHWQSTTVYIGVDDIDAKLAEIAAAGGQVVIPKTQISPEMGYFAVFSDPAGNSLGLYSSK